MLEYNISNPPVKWGYKCWCSCDSANCYMTWTSIRVLAVHWMRLPRCHNCSTYDGATVWLQSQCLHRQYLKHIKMNKLKDNGTVMIGTAWSNRPSWPKEMKGIKNWINRWHRDKTDSRQWMGSSMLCGRTGGYSGSLTTQLPHPSVHSSEAWKRRLQIVFTLIVERQTYNTYIGEDAFDSRRNTYFSSRKNRKWWL